MSANIEPCPLCASKANTFKFALVFWGVKCSSCMLVLKDMNTSEAGAIKQWGTRISPEEKKAAKKGKKTKAKSKGDFLFYVDGELISVWPYEEHIPHELSIKHSLFISDTITAEHSALHRGRNTTVTWNCNGHCKLLFKSTEKE